MTHVPVHDRPHQDEKKRCGWCQFHQQGKISPSHIWATEFIGPNLLFYGPSSTTKWPMSPNTTFRQLRPAQPNKQKKKLHWPRRPAHSVTHPVRPTPEPPGIQSNGPKPPHRANDHRALSSSRAHPISNPRGDQPRLQIPDALPKFYSRTRRVGAGAKPPPSSPKPT